MVFFFARTFIPAVVREPTYWTEVFYADAYLCLVHFAVRHLIYKRSTSFLVLPFELICTNAIMLDRAQGIYPTILVVLVCLKKTFHENLALFPHDIATPPVLRDAKFKTEALPGTDEISSEPELHHIPNHIPILSPHPPNTGTQTDGRLASAIQIGESFDSDYHRAL